MNDDNYDDDYPTHAKGIPRESPPARAELDAEKERAERYDEVYRMMHSMRETMAGNYVQMEDDLAALRVELRRVKGKQ